MNLNLKMTVERSKRRSYFLSLVFITKCFTKNLLKQKKYLIIVIKRLLTILTNIKAKEIDYFEMLIFLNIEENTLFCSQDESS